MNTGKRMKYMILTALLSVRVVCGQEDHQHHHHENEKLGEVRFPISCSPIGQQKFTRGLALLHSFQYVDAGSAFKEIRTSEPGCAMAWWGEAMSLYHPLWAPPTPIELEKGRESIEKASAVDAKTKREKDYIAALGTFYRNAEQLDHWERARAYAAAMEGIYRRYPADREAAIFYALALNGAAPASEKNLANRTKAARILYRVWSQAPNHPGIAHYLIHSYDYPTLARLALPAARRYAKVAPDSAHALHMPSHIFTRLGMWSDSIVSNTASASVAKRKVEKESPGAAAQDQLHAMDYLMYAFLQGAQDDQAKKILDEAMAYTQVEHVVFQAGFAWAAIPARYTLERRQWKEAASLELRPAKFPWDRFPFAEANLHFARAIGAARSGDAEAAQREVQQLTSIQEALAGAKIGYDWATQVQIQRNGAAAWLAYAEGKNDEAERLLRAAAEIEDSTDKHPVTPGSILPAREMLGDLLVERKQPGPALKEFEAVLQTAPNRFNSLYGAAHAAELMGDQRRARTYYAKLIAVCGQGSSRREELQTAKAYLNQRTAERKAGSNNRGAEAGR